MTSSLKKTSLATLMGLAFAVPFAATAADTSAAAKDNKAYSADMKSMTQERDALEKAMPAGHKADFYRSKLTSMGWQLTVVNDQEPDYLEYEAVKGTNSIEVQIDRDKATGVASEVDVEPNLWRADSTKAALTGNKFEPMSTADHSDRKYEKASATEKEALKKALPTGHDKAFYAAKLKELGYKVTSTNDSDRNEVEWEVVKGQNSYEVQVDFDASTKMAKDVDVTPNVWESEATERKLGKS